MLPEGGDVAPPLLISPLCFALLELLVCWVRSLPDTRLRDLTFTDRKSRERERARASEREAQRERGREKLEPVQPATSNPHHHLLPLVQPTDD